MSSCPWCRQAVCDEARFCLSCGADVGSGFATETALGEVEQTLSAIFLVRRSSFLFCGQVRGRSAFPTKSL